jgi:hypothetical protein
MRTKAKSCGKAEPMTAAEFETLDEVDAERILVWRFESLVDSGYDPDRALVLATRVHIDLHEATGLVRRGCPPGTAMRILL